MQLRYNEGKCKQKQGKLCTAPQGLANVVHPFMYDTTKEIHTYFWGTKVSR